MAKRYPQLPFERFADDAIVHCRTELEAQEVRAAIAARLQECGLELHLEKTKVVYCKDDDRRRRYPNEKFDFLGYTFRPLYIERWLQAPVQEEDGQLVPREKGTPQGGVMSPRTQKITWCRV